MASNYFGNPSDVSWAKAVASGKMKLPRNIPRDKAVAWIKAGSGGKIFACSFIKRTTGTLRVMVCRHGVKSHSKGIGLSFDPVAHRLIIVFDMQISKYRCIAIEGLKTLTIKGKAYKVK